MKEISITILDGDEKRELKLESGTPLSRLVSQDPDFGQMIVAAKVDRRLVELGRKLYKPAEVEFVTTENPIGFDMYKRSLVLLMLRACENTFSQKKIQVLYSLGQGYFCTVREKDGTLVALTQEDLERLRGVMLELVAKKLPIEKKVVTTHEAVKMFRERGMEQKAELFRYRRASRVNLYCMDGYEDYFCRSFRGVAHRCLPYLEDLAERLYEDVAASRGDDPFARSCVVVGHSLRGYERYLIERNKTLGSPARTGSTPDAGNIRNAENTGIAGNSGTAGGPGKFQIYCFVPSLITGAERNRILQENVSVRISPESESAGIYKSFNYEIFERRPSIVIAMDGNSAGENLIQEARNGKGGSAIFIWDKAVPLRKKAESLEGYVHMFGKDSSLSEQMQEQIGG